MLAFMRRKANSWLMTALFAAIIFVFALNFGPWAGNPGGERPFAAEVNEKVITMSQYQTAFASHINQMQRYRPEYTAEQAEKDGVPAKILEQLIAQELLAQLAISHGLSVPSKELAQAVKDRIFGEKEPFNLEQYKQIINSYFQMTPSQFENQLSREMLAEQAAQLLATGGQITEDDVKIFYNEYNTKIAVEYVSFDPSKLTVAKDQQKETAQKMAQELIAQLQKGVELEALSLPKGLAQVKKGSTELFSRAQRNTPAELSTEMTRAAFTLAGPKATSSVVFYNKGMVVVIRLKDMQKPDEKLFAEQQKSLTEGLIYQRKNQFVQQYIEYLKKNARIVQNPSIAKV